VVTRGYSAVGYIRKSIVKKPLLEAERIVGKPGGKATQNIHRAGEERRDPH